MRTRINILDKLIPQSPQRVTLDVPGKLLNQTQTVSTVIAKMRLLLVKMMMVSMMTMMVSMMVMMVATMLMVVSMSAHWPTCILHSCSSRDDHAVLEARVFRHKLRLS